jgi:hypothetical protein
LFIPSKVFHTCSVGITLLEISVPALIKGILKLEILSGTVVNDHI